MGHLLGISPDGSADAGVVLVAAVGAWVCAAWLALVVVLALLARLRGRVGKGAASLVRRVTPAAVHAALGVGVALVALPGTAAADDGHRWPDLDRPVATAPGESYLVQPGDCLWTIAEHDLARHDRSVTPRLVATEWPQWYAANRRIIGPDPDLIRPGERLRRPHPTTGAGR